MELRSGLVQSPAWPGFVGYHRPEGEILRVGVLLEGFRIVRRRGRTQTRMPRCRPPGMRFRATVLIFPLPTPPGIDTK